VVGAPSQHRGPPGVLAADFERTHGRPPSQVESLQLAQQATLETREASTNLAAWPSSGRHGFAQAVDVLGGPDVMQLIVEQALNPRHPQHTMSTALKG